MDNYIILLFFTITILFLFSFFKLNKNMISPSNVTLFMFFISSLCIVYNYNFWRTKYSFKSYLIVVITLVLILICELFIKNRAKKAFRNYKNEFQILEIDKFLNIILISLLLFFLIYQINEVMILGKKLGGKGWNIIGVVKNTPNIKLSSISRIAFRYNWIIFMVYSYIFFNNVERMKEKIWRQMKYLFPVLTLFISSFILGNRAAIIRLFIVLYVFWIITKIESKGSVNLNLFSIIKKILPISLLLLLLFYGLRSITKINTTTKGRSFIDYITYYIGSPLYLFDKYLKNPLLVKEYPNYFGENTFASLYKNFGVNIDLINKYILVGGKSNFAGNVYSWFQIPYHDFGFCGMLLFTLIIYSIYCYIFYKKIYMTKNSYKRDCYIFCYAYFFYVIVMSFYYCQINITISILNFFYITGTILLYKICKNFKLKRRKNNERNNTCRWKWH